MKTVWKFPIEIADLQVVKMPAMAEVVHVGLDPLGVPCIWAKVDPAGERIDYPVYITGTGAPLPESTAVQHLGSFVQKPWVWHAWMPSPPNKT